MASRFNSLRPLAMQTPVESGDLTSFHGFLKSVHELDTQLGKFSKQVRQVGRSSGILSAVQNLRRQLVVTEFMFLKNATRLHPNLREPELEKRVASNTKITAMARAKRADELPDQLQDCAAAFRELKERLDDFPDYTDESVNIKYFLIRIEQFLNYRASCLEVQRASIHMPATQRYIHNMIADLEQVFNEFRTDLKDFATIGVPAIGHEHQRDTENLLNISTIATFFSAVTATTLQMSSTGSSRTTLTFIVNTFWFTSLVFSIGAALNSVLASAWKKATYGTRGRLLPPGLTLWINGSPLAFLTISIASFLTGLVLYAYSTDQPRYTTGVTLVGTIITSAGLAVLLGWFAWERGLRFFQSDLATGTDGFSSPATYSPIRPRLRPEGPLGPGGNQYPPMSMQQKTPFTKRDTEAESRLSESQSRNENPDQDEWQAFSPVDHSPRAQPRVLSATDFPHLIDIPTLSEQTIDLERKGQVQAMKYSPNGQRLAITCYSAGTGSATSVYDVTNGYKEVHTRQHNVTFLKALQIAWSQDSKMILIRFQRFIDLCDGDPQQLSKHVRPPIRVDTSGDVYWCNAAEGHAFISAQPHQITKKGLGGETIATYALESHRIRQIYHSPQSSDLILFLGELKMAPNGVAHIPEVWSPECQVSVYNRRDRQIIRTIPFLLENIRYVSFGMTSDELIIGSELKPPHIWNTNGQYPERRTICHAPFIPFRHPESVGPQARFLASPSKEGDLYLWEHASGRLIHHKRPADLTERIRMVSAGPSSPEKFSYATASQTRVRVWVHKLPNETGGTDNRDGASTPQASRPSTPQTQPNYTPTNGGSATVGAGEDEDEGGGGDEGEDEDEEVEDTSDASSSDTE